MLTAAAAPVVSPLVARAQASTIKLIVPVPPGGSLDPIARLAQPGLQERLGETVIVENKPGASGSVGAALVAKAPPDGTTWLFVYETQAINPFLMRLTYDSKKDFEPVQLIGTAPAILAKSASRPWKTFQELLAVAKEKPNSISYASTGVGSIGHLAMTALSARAGVQMIHVPYKGGGPALKDAVAGQVDSIIGSVALTSPQIQAGKLAGLLNFGGTRLKTMPDVPTAVESGFPGLEAYAWWGVFAPKGTPSVLVERFSRALADILREDKNARQMSEVWQINSRLNGPAELKRFFESQMALWGPVVRENHISD
jgi:tripartite-type tricarboxylate transporter receptor subunit TctC